MSVIVRRPRSGRKPLVSVLTPSVPERGEMLDECVASVEAQTFSRWEHLILVDKAYQGCSATMNRLAEAATAEWLFLIADDDLMLPGCLAAHVESAGGAGVVFSPPFVEGEPEAPFHGDPPGIPAVALIRTALWRELGGYDLERSEQEDLDFFERCLYADVRFHRLAAQLWIYRFHGANKSRGQKFGQPRP